MDDNIESSLLPELLKMILTKAVLVQMFSEDTDKRRSDESIFSSLVSVDFLWWSSMKTSRIKNKIRHLSKVYFQRVKMRSTIIRSNRNFLKEVIDPDKIIFPLESCGCLTADQVTFLTRLKNYKEKNHELLFMLQDFSSQKYAKLLDCLFSTNQTPAAVILESGGEAMKVHIHNGNAKWTREFEKELIERFQRMQTENTLILNDLLNASDEKILNDVFILHAKQNKGIELWFWCKTESSLNQLKRLSDKDLRKIIQRMYKRLIPEHSASFEPQLIEMDSILANAFAERRLLIRHEKDRDSLTGFEFFRNFEFSQCVASFTDKIYVAQLREILVYKNKYPYQSLDTIALGRIGFPISIASCNMNKCLYISANVKIYKLEPEFYNRMSIWLDDTSLYPISVTSRGDILVLQIGSANNKLRKFTCEGTVTLTISMEQRFNQARYIQEIMPGIVALSYARGCIEIMRLDEKGTVLRNVELRQEVFDLSSFRYGELLIGVSKYENAAMRSNSSDLYQGAQNFHDFLFPKLLRQWNCAAASLAL